MNWDQLEGKWHQVKGSMRVKWARLTDDDVRSVAGRKEVLTGKLQERYGIAKDEAEKQADEWVAKLAVEMDVEVHDSGAAVEKKERREHEAEGGAAGAVAGGLLGAIGGPVGAVAGAVIGAAAGALTGFAANRDGAEQATENATLDEEIGVSKGELGAPNLKHPPATIGAYSGASSGGPPPTAKPRRKARSLPLRVDALPPGRQGFDHAANARMRGCVRHWSGPGTGC